MGDEGSGGKSFASMISSPFVREEVSVDGSGAIRSGAAEEVAGIVVLMEVGARTGDGT